MKKIIALAAALLSVSTFAINEKSSWEEIKAAEKADVNLSMNYGPVFVGQPVSAFDVCIDGDIFVTTRKFPIYKTVRVPRSRDNDGDRDGYTSVKVGEKLLSYPITYTSYKEVCNGRDKNCKRVAYTVHQDLEKDFTVSKVVRRGGHDRDDVTKALFTKTYVIPACN